MLKNLVIEIISFTMSSPIAIYLKNSATGHASTATVEELCRLLKAGVYQSGEISRIIFGDTGRVLSPAKITVADGQTQSIWVLNENPVQQGTQAWARDEEQVPIQNVQSQGGLVSASASLLDLLNADTNTEADPEWISANALITYADGQTHSTNAFFEKPSVLLGQGRLMKVVV